MLEDQGVRARSKADNVGHGATMHDAVDLELRCSTADDISLLKLLN